MPHPLTAIEIAATHVAAARWGHGISHLGAMAVEPLPEGTLAPSATQVNVASGEALRVAIRNVLSKVDGERQIVSLLVPDPAIRVFILQFESFPRRIEEALPMLRWRLKKSLPFDADEAAISWMRQLGHGGKIEVVAAVARQKIIREYESAVEDCGAVPGVVQSSTLATLPMVEDTASTLLARLSGRHLAAVIVRGQTICVYRLTEIGREIPLTPRAVFDEIYPAIAFYQDSWGGKVERVRMAGFGTAENEMRDLLMRELNCSAELLESAENMSEQARKLVTQGFESLVGWQMNAGV
jgi:type IV pilus assembly protein PilM